MNLVARRRGRPPGMSVDRFLKRMLIVEAIISGVKIAEVARQIGVSRSWASREARAPGTRQIVADLLATRPEKIEQLLHRSCQVIIDALGAEKIVRRNGEMINLGPDHRVRLDAVEVALQYFKALDAEHWVVLTRRQSSDRSEVHIEVPFTRMDRRPCSHGCR